MVYIFNIKIWEAEAGESQVQVSINIWAGSRIFFIHETKIGDSWQVQWCMPVIPALRRQGQKDQHRFKVKLVCVVRSRPVRAIQQDSVSYTQQEAGERAQWVETFAV